MWLSHLVDKIDTSGPWERPEIREESHKYFSFVKNIIMILL